MSPKDRIIEPIDSTPDLLAEILVTPSGPHKKTNKNNELIKKPLPLGPTLTQGDLFHVERQVEIDGVEMGVLENGIPYLTERGLARMCGIDRKVLNRLAVDWADEKEKPRGRQIADLLAKSGYFEPGLFLRSEHKGTAINAYTEPVCMALLEYYAFLADDKRPEAISAFRSLARATFRTFIYQATGYKPEQRVLDSWKHFHDRVDMTVNSVPMGFFSVWQEIAGMIVPMIRAGVMISDKVVPDISVGRTWAAYWRDNDLTKTHGEKIEYNHEYPIYYPQAKSNPQEAAAYPDSALGVFRAWLREHYILNKFPAYLLGQAQKGSLEVHTANKALEAFGSKQIEYTPRKKLPKPE